MSRLGKRAVKTLRFKVPLLAGVFDVCLLAPLVKLPFQGDELRRQT